jgi:hypothetical protein
MEADMVRILIAITTSVLLCFFSQSAFSQEAEKKAPWLEIKPKEASAWCSSFQQGMRDGLHGEVSEQGEKYTRLALSGFKGEFLVNCDVKSELNISDGFTITGTNEGDPSDIWWKYYAIAISTMTGMAQEDALKFGMMCMEKAKKDENNSWAGIKLNSHIDCSSSNGPPLIIATFSPDDKKENCTSIADGEYNCYDDNLEYNISQLIRDKSNKIANASRDELLDIKIVGSDDLYVSERKYIGKYIEVKNTNCFYADINEYRCFARKKYQVAMFSSKISPDEEKERLEKECGSVDDLFKKKCARTIRLVPEKFGMDGGEGLNRRRTITADVIEIVVPKKAEALPPSKAKPKRSARTKQPAGRPQEYIRDGRSEGPDPGVVIMHGIIGGVARGILQRR